MNVAGIIHGSAVNGEGIRFVIFLAGCEFKCKGCQNKEFQDSNSGKYMTISELVDELRLYSDFYDGLTLTGGDPLYQKKEIIEFLNEIKQDEILKRMNVWLYTGQLFHDIPKEIKDSVDVIVDGRYERGRKSAMWRGSDNQKIYRKQGGTKTWKRTKDIQ